VYARCACPEPLTLLYFVMMLMSVIVEYFTGAAPQLQPARVRGQHAALDAFARDKPNVHVMRCSLVK